MEQIIRLLIVFFVLSLFFALIETLFAANPYPTIRKGFKTDVVYWLMTPLVSKSITTLGLGLILSAVFLQNPKNLEVFLAQRESWATALPLWLQIFLIILIGDIVGYWTHRWFHSRRMWKFHAVHHSPEQLNWLSAVRIHPVNEALSKWIQAMALLALGFNYRAVAAYVPFLTFYALFVHANVGWGFGWLGKIFVSPRFHRWHHTSEEEGLDKNFAGIFPFIDRIFGTYYMPQEKLPQHFGVYNDAVPDGFWQQMKYPFTRKRSG